MVATTESMAPADPRWRAHARATGDGGVAPGCALLESSGLEPDEGEPSVAIFSLPEIELIAPVGSGEPHRRLRWVGWIRRRVIHGVCVL